MTPTVQHLPIDNRWRTDMLDLSNRPLLNKAFHADGIFSLIAGSVLIVAAAPVAALASPGLPPEVIMALGAGLLAWGAFHLAAARKGGPNTIATRISIAGDVLWQIASLAILASAHSALTIAGIALIAMAMVGVADFLFFKMRGASQARLFQAA
ncbi:hypothetical protein GOD83_14105 [Sinorhizobium medicae]|nr:hypothetical protein [Sinorhizobium medicae]MDX0577719.1 hypothetical protein [Sinorhizobium medicae]MDX0781469.1 hypothetical protein [Sinorhizobium medicae]